MIPPFYCLTTSRHVNEKAFATETFARSWTICFEHLLQTFCFDFKLCCHYHKRTYFSVIYREEVEHVRECYMCYRKSVERLLCHYLCFSCYMKIKFKKFSARAIEPSLATSGSACFDLASAEEVIIPPRSCQCIKTDIGIAILKDYFGKVHARSSWARRFTSVAGRVIDSNYRGKISVILHNYSDNWLQVHQSDKFAQIAIQKKAANVVFEEVKSFEDTTERGEGGFGSTNKTCRGDVEKGTLT